jgi:hypothetical protein
VHFDQPLGEGKTDSKPALRFSHIALNLGKRVENNRELIVGNADALILDR